MEQGLTPEQALVLAVNRLGSQASMARLCDVKQPSVWHWLNESKQLPAEHVLKVEAATRVARHDLRPDLYPRGLQDDTPYELAATLDLGGDLVAENSREISQSPEHSLSGGQASTAIDKNEFPAAAGGGR